MNRRKITSLKIKNPKNGEGLNALPILFVLSF